jgi:hypothetical protein
MKTRAFWPVGQHRRIAILNFFFGQGDGFIPLYVTIIVAAVIGRAWKSNQTFRDGRHNARASNARRHALPATSATSDSE